MVLQRDVEVPVWGWATPGESVTVSLDDNGFSAKATADASGNWRTKLPSTPAGGPHKLTVAGKNTIALQNILFGEVWLCSGQSNMEWPLKATQHAGRDIPQAEDSQLRLCKVDPIVASRQQPDGVSNWFESNPGSVGNFSAVAYYFGKELREKLKVPVGIIVCSAGGTAIETWLSAEACSQVPSLAKINRLVEQVNTDYRKQQEKNLDAWVAEARRSISEDAAIPPFKPIDPIIIQRGWLPTGIYNGGINPLIPFAIRGVIWYQGEANNGDGMLYFEKLKALIASWRKAWGQGDFPFLIAQIAPWSGYPNDNVQGIWEAQRAALALPNTGMAVTTDLVPNIHDIHPQRKLEVGQRLALWAFAKVYGQNDVVYSGPLPKSVIETGGRLRIEFDHVGSGLTTRDGKAPDSFQVGTATGFEDAQAKIDGNAIEVLSDKVPKPEFVRFGWKNTAQPNLMNREGLPASPFRTDISSVRFNSGNRFASRKKIELTSDAPGTIRYTLDGTIPKSSSTEYTGPFELDRPATVTARNFSNAGPTSVATKNTYEKIDPVVTGGKSYGPGLDYDYFVGKWSALPDFESLKIERTGVVDSLTLAASPVSTQFALRFRGYLQVPRDGDYTFLLKSDDGAKLFLDGKLAIDDDGQHGAAGKKSDPLSLKAGMHPFELLYHESWGGSGLNLFWEGPELPQQEIPAAAYFREE
jgi:sialate O-acetylesterase